MTQSIQTVVGIDVGGERKGFHAVALRDSNFIEKTADRDPNAIVDWCLEKEAKIVAVDAPCQCAMGRCSFHSITQGYASENIILYNEEI